jgi:hypothetical protein
LRKPVRWDVFDQRQLLAKVLLTQIEAARASS